MHQPTAVWPNDPSQQEFSPVRAPRIAERFYRTQQYSITALTDLSGTIKERYAYDAYGGVSIFDNSGSSRSATAEGNRSTYTGREWDDELGLYHYRARMYDPICGRFLSRDPIGYLDSQNLYRNNFGTRDVDPTGRKCTFTGRKTSSSFEADGLLAIGTVADGTSPSPAGNGFVDEIRCRCIEKRVDNFACSAVRWRNTCGVWLPRIVNWNKRVAKYRTIVKKLPARGGQYEYTSIVILNADKFSVSIAALTQGDQVFADMQCRAFCQRNKPAGPWKSEPDDWVEGLQD
ncbi:RHS repeat-associated core domain-containing protein [Roseiconus nitratireducens]|uniref:RHS repeat-associated core domain-containing protein n=1 Tax=Roseiconus nitratireducens TaxID=2605748 RepID=A0A5M6D1P3_9BACT|nr:RHS repeat-associated core domain-containing protein [Roseiconus nitratireducens]